MQDTFVNQNIPMDMYGNNIPGEKYINSSHTIQVTFKIHIILELFNGRISSFNTFGFRHNNNSIKIIQHLKVYRHQQ